MENQCPVCLNDKAQSKIINAMDLREVHCPRCTVFVIDGDLFEDLPEDKEIRPETRAAMSAWIRSQKGKARILKDNVLRLQIMDRMLTPDRAGVLLEYLIKRQERYGTVVHVNLADLALQCVTGSIDNVDLRHLCRVLEEMDGLIKVVDEAGTDLLTCTISTHAHVYMEAVTNDRARQQRRRPLGFGKWGGEQI